MVKKIAAGRVAGKVDRDAQRRREIAEELGTQSGGAWEAQAEAALGARRSRERDRVRVREEAPSGFRYSSTGWLEQTDGPTLADVVNAPRREVTDTDRWIAGRLRDLTEIATFGAGLLAPAAAALTVPPPVAEPGRGYQMTPAGIVPLDPPTPAELEEPAKAPAWALDRLRGAYIGAFGREPEAEWKHVLRLHVVHALHNRQGKRREGADKSRKDRDRTTYAVRHPGTGKIVATDGDGLLGILRMVCPPGTVPRGLTAKVIDKVLQTATLGRGGGNKLAKRHSNVDTALDALFAALAPKA